MILVDTSIWIDHLRQRDERLSGLLDQGQGLAHPFVIGELALGNLQNRHAILGALQELPQAPVTTDAEVLGFIAGNGLHGMGIGCIDAHLLAATRLAPGAMLWTRDKRLLAAGMKPGLAEISVLSGVLPVGKPKLPQAPYSCASVNCTSHRPTLIFALFCSSTATGAGMRCSDKLAT